jgi:hypothetical protein
MATWECDLLGLRVHGTDPQGWPITEVVELIMQLDEDNIMRLFSTAHERAREQFPECADFLMQAVDRIDKDTRKAYDGLPNPREMRYQLDEGQQQKLRQIKAQIMADVTGQGVDQAMSQAPFAHVDGGSVHWVSDAVAFLGDQGGLYTHEEARQVLDALERFYDHVTEEHLAILRMDDAALRHEELLIVRGYTPPGQ